MSERVNFRLTKKLKDAIEQDVEQNADIGSVNEWVTKATEHFLTCKKAWPTMSMKPIITKYPGKCIKCGKEIGVGEWALYGRGIGLICGDCYIMRIGDKAYVAKYMKMRELEHMIKAFKNQLKGLAEEVDVYACADKIDKIRKEADELRSKCMDYLKRKIGTAEEAKALEAVIRTTEKQLEVLRRIEEFLSKRLFMVIKKKKKKAEYVT